MCSNTTVKQNRNNPIREAMRLSLGGRCVKCGSTENLQFDHIDPDTKSFEISVALSDYMPEDLVWEELDKCQLLCIGHHSEKTMIDRRRNDPEALNYNAKIDRQKAEEIRRLYEEGGHTLASLGAIYGIKVPTVSDIVRGKTWKG